MKKLLILFLAIALTACGAVPSEFDRNQQKWQDANISHYRFNVVVGCFCAFRSDMPITVEVQNNEIISITTVNGKVVEKTDTTYDLFAKYATIPNLFTELKSESEKADEVKVTYDATYGYPSSVYIDLIKDAVDDELSLTVSNFEKLS